VRRLLLQQRNRKGCTQEPLQFQRFPLVASQGWKQRKVNHEIAVENKRKDWEERLLLNGSLLWWGTILLDWLFPLVCHGLGDFFSGEGGQEDVKWWKCMRVDLQSTKGAILLAMRAHWEWWLAGVH
jgi:hypothetical protein